MSDSVLVKLQGFDKATWNAALLLASKDAADAKFSVVDPSSVRFKMSDIEKQAKKQQYRREYRKRPEVIKRLEAKNNDPLVLEARKLYAEDPEVKQRKKEYAAARRKLLQEMKHSHSDIYNELKTKIMPPSKPRKKRSLEDTTAESAQPAKRIKLDNQTSAPKAVQILKDSPVQRASTITSFSVKKK